MNTQTEQAIDAILNSKNLVFFGGAGVSTESGIPDFRSADGIYNQNYHLSPEEIVSHTFFTEHTGEFYEFYKEKMVYPDALPNITHTVLAQLERMGILKAVVTQNIDGLHQMAGSKHVVELHGSVHRNYCMKCHKAYGLDKILEEGVPHCTCGGLVKPDVVLYEEALKDADILEAIHAVSEADTLIVAGTSLAVYPAAGMLRYFRGNTLILINKSETPMDHQADIVIHDALGNVMSQLQARLDKEDNM